MNVPENYPPPPQNLAHELHGAFAQLCGRLLASGAEVSELDAIVVARVAQAEASLERARAEAAQAPLIIGSPANGECVHPAQRLLQSAEANLRAWLKLLPRGSGGRIPSPHVPTPAPAGGDAAEPPGQPSEGLQRLRAIIREFQASTNAAGGGAAVDAADAGGGVAGAAGAPAADAPAAGVAVC